MLGLCPEESRWMAPRHSPHARHRMGDPMSVQPYEAGTQPQVQTDGHQTSQSPPSPELTSEENKIPDADKVSDSSSSFH